MLPFIPDPPLDDLLFVICREEEFAQDRLHHNPPYTVHIANFIDRSVHPGTPEDFNVPFRGKFVVSTERLFNQTSIAHHDPFGIPAMLSGEANIAYKV